MITKVTLVSENCFFGVLPEYDTEMEQRLTIRSDGRVWLSRYAIAPRGKNYRMAAERYSVDPRHVAELLRKLIPTTNLFAFGD